VQHGSLNQVTANKLVVIIIIIYPAAASCKLGALLVVLSRYLYLSMLLRATSNEMLNVDNRFGLNTLLTKPTPDCRWMNCVLCNSRMCLCLSAYWVPYQADSILWYVQRSTGGAIVRPDHVTCCQLEWTASKKRVELRWNCFRSMLIMNIANSVTIYHVTTYARHTIVKSRVPIATRSLFLSQCSSFSSWFHVVAIISGRNWFN